MEVYHNQVTRAQGSYSLRMNRVGGSRNSVSRPNSNDFDGTFGMASYSV
jgi:hypothetical protein